MEHSAPSELGSMGVDTKKLGMWTFLGSEVMLFTGLIATYLVFRGRSLEGPTPAELFADPTIVAFNTLVLLCSSLTMVLAHGLHQGIPSGRGDDRVILALRGSRLGSDLYARLSSEVSEDRRYGKSITCTQPRAALRD